MKRSFFYSATLHLMLLLALLTSNDSSKNTPKNTSDQGQGDTKKIVAKGTTEENIAEISLVEMPAKRQKLKGDDCQDSHWYGGIGIYEGWDINGSYVDNVISGYPADKVGLKVGDRFISDITQVRGTPGTTIDVVVSRENITLYFTLIREKICTE